METKTTRYECPCGLIHPSFTGALRCGGCVKYLDALMLSRWECPIIKRTS